jgi:hypothetical protein
MRGSELVARQIARQPAYVGMLVGKTAYGLGHDVYRRHCRSSEVMQRASELAPAAPDVEASFAAYRSRRLQHEAESLGLNALIGVIQPMLPLLEHGAVIRAPEFLLRAH